MANNCFYDMRITGKKKSVEEMIRIIQGVGEFKYDSIGRVFDCCIVDDEQLKSANEDDVVSVDVCGDCAWSIESSMLVNDSRNLLTETKRLNLVIEAYSSEPGIGFQEHILVALGAMYVDECVDYSAYWVQEFDTLEEFNEEYGKNFTEDMVNENGDVCIGGFGDDYGVYEDHIKYFEEV